MTVTSFEGKTAFITGGAKGIGLGIAKAFVKRGATVMLADIDSDALEAAKHLLGDAVDTVRCDVASAESLKEAAEKTIARFGNVHLLVNNAGVGGGGLPGGTSLDDWRWVVDINLMGVVYGVETFVPHMKSHGQGGHIINTASLAGIVAAPETGAPYNATKYAVVGYSETLRAQLARDNIGCSALCPAWVDTDIHKSGFRAPSGATVDVEQAMQSKDFQRMDAILKAGLSPDLVGEWTAECILENRKFIFTHPKFLPGIEASFDELRADYLACAKDPRFQ